MNTPPEPLAPSPSFTPAVFLALSSGLTGVSVNQLQPPADSSKAAHLFHAALCEGLPGEILRRLVVTFLSANTVTEGAAEILIDTELAPVGRSIIRLWLTGVWHDPSAPAAPGKSVCDQTYRRSSAWRIMQAHPMNDHILDPSH